MPLPLAYLQHCRVLLFLFSLIYPVFIHQDYGFVENVALPSVIFWSLMGFQVLAEELENPLGGEDTDINALEMVHNLECHAQQVFHTTGALRTGTRRALWRPLRDFHMSPGPSVPDPSVSMGCGGGGPQMPSHEFSTYFCWLPMPAPLLELIIENHGHVDSVHQAFLTGSTSLQDLIRRRLKQPEGKADGGTYQALGQNSPREALLREDAAIVEALRRDPNVFCHYLVFRGAHAARVAVQGPEADRLTSDRVFPDPIANLATQPWRRVEIAAGSPQQGDRMRNNGCRPNGRADPHALKAEIT